MPFKPYLLRTSAASNPGFWKIQAIATYPIPRYAIFNFPKLEEFR